MSGKVWPETEKPVPVIVADFTVMLEDPVAVKVNDWDVGVFSVVLPNEMLVEFTDRPAAAAAASFRETVCELLAVDAFSVTVCAVVTEPTLAVNEARVAVAGTVTEDGTLTEELLLARATFVPPEGADPDRFTVHVSAVAPVMDVLLQENALIAGADVAPVPLRLTVAVGALLEIVSCPVDELAVVGA